MASFIICEPRKENKQNQTMFNKYLFSSEYQSSVINQPDPMGPIVFIIPPHVFTFNYVNQIGSGVYGKVYHFYENIYKINIAIKCCKNNKEEKIAEDLCNSDCKTLLSKPAGVSLYVNGNLENHCIFMELAEGTLRKYFTKLNSASLSVYELHKKILSIAEEVRQQMVCIYNLNNNYVYTDLKLDNVLYKCDDRKKLDQVRILLGDLGSAIKDDHNEYIATYPPYEYRYSNGFILLDTERKKLDTMAWQLGVLLLSIYHGNKPEFVELQYNEIDVIDFFGHDTFIKLYEYMEVSYGPDIARLLAEDPNNRRSILDPIPIPP